MIGTEQDMTIVVEGAQVSVGDSQSFALVVVLPSTGSLVEVACPQSITRSAEHECSSSSDSSELSPLVIAGIVVAIVFVLVVVGAACFFCMRKQG